MNLKIKTKQQTQIVNLIYDYMKENPNDKLTKFLKPAMENFDDSENMSEDKLYNEKETSNSHPINTNIKLKRALEIIRDAFWSDGESDKEKVEDLKSIAFNILYEIDNNIFNTNE